jgi:hypothetical protein
MANYVALGFCLGILSFAGILIAFMETWLKQISALNHAEQRDQVDAELAQPEPETRA